MADTLTTQLNRSGAAILMTVSITDVADVNLSALSLETLASLVLWYLLGYAFYSFMYGALGATISRQKDMQGGAILPVLLILPGFLLGQMALPEPDS